MNEEMSFEDKYRILGTKNTQYDGIFVTAVKTTGIFCRPSCRARIPKAENVGFYDSAQEALENGFRPCKICKPMQMIGNAPACISAIIEELQKNPDEKISDSDLKNKGVEPHTIRRWFKKNYDMTFHQFQKMLRINYAFTHIRKGKSVTFAAFESGYESLSGFNESYRSIFGESASKSKYRTVVNTLRFSSPIGSLIACASETGICFLGFVGQKKLEENITDIQKKLSAVMIPGINPYLIQVRKELGEYFKGNRTNFSVPLHIIGTDFRKQTWSELLNIPYGETRTYSQQASAMNHEKSVRAVASANAMNKISIIIPCHRVIGSNGKISGYAGGLPKKRWLLELEKTNSGPRH